MDMPSFLKGDQLKTHSVAVVLGAVAAMAIGFGWGGWMLGGTAQKMVLNMISTSVMIQIGRVKGNSMVNMMLTNTKLVERGTRMVMEQAGIQDAETARALLIKYGSVKKAIESTYS